METSPFTTSKAVQASQVVEGLRASHSEHREDYVRWNKDDQHILDGVTDTGHTCVSYEPAIARKRRSRGREGLTL